MKAYADKCDADYLFEENPRWIKGLGKYSPHYGVFKIIFDDAFDDYDDILYLDVDIFPVDGVEENIFDAAPGSFGWCTEPHQPDIRYAEKKFDIRGENEEKWSSMVKSLYGTELPRTIDNKLMVYNSGVVLWTKAGRETARKNLPDFKHYINMCSMHGLPPFYQGDQNYLLAVASAAKLNWVELDNGWNSYLHYQGPGNPRPVNDMRDRNTKFVHVQLSSADEYSSDTIHTIVNNPPTVWNGKLPKV